MAKTVKKSKLQAVIIRSQSAGVHFGYLVSRNGSEVVLNGSRRIWRWFGVETCSGLATAGLNVSKSRVEVRVNGHTVLGVIEVLPCSAAAVASLEAATWVK